MEPSLKTAVCTVVAKNYLPFARCLMDSVRRLHPDWRRVVVLADRVDGCFDPAREDFETVVSEDLGIPGSAWFHFQYSILELSTATKPWALESLLDRYGLDRVIYLDPDIKLYRPLSRLVASLDDASILLLPHVTGSLDDGLLPGDLEILRSGVWNLGFLGLAARPEARRFLKWWQGKLRDRCLVAPDDGIFVDQRWVDLAPSLFSEVAFNREPGYDVAYWNLKHRPVKREGDGYTAAGEPLYFYHFSGFDPNEPERFSKHQNRYRLSDTGDLAPLVMEYREELLARGYAEARGWPYAYGFFRNGQRIPDSARRLAWERRDLRKRIADPFGEEGFQEFRRAGCLSPEDAQRWERFSPAARQAWESRTDIQHAFPDPLGADALGFLRWLLTYGRSELRIEKSSLACARREWAERVRWLGGPRERARARLSLMAMSAAVTARRLLQGGSAWNAARAARPVRRPDRSGAPGPRVEGLGLNIVGYLRSETGVGEAARSAVLAAKRCGLPVSLKSVDVGDRSRQEDRRLGAVSDELSHGATVFYVNADQVPAVAAHLGPETYEGRYNIGAWNWELENFPDEWAPSFRYYNEIWVPSAFCQDAISHKSPVPVVRIPYCVEPPELPRLSRADFGLPPGEFIFLTVFDMLSVFERKNPLATIEAFRSAFGGRQGLRLVVKINNAQQRPAQLERLRAAAEGLPVTIMDRVIPHADLMDLTACCDSMVSLHRSEGYGFTLAEAMCLGKPVIATAYSGNMDFTLPGNSFLVGYSRKRVGKGAEPYPEDAFWADPSVEDAAAHMRTVAENAPLRERVAAAGQSFVRDRLSPEAVGGRMSGRIEWVAKSCSR